MKLRLNSIKIILYFSINAAILDFFYFYFYFFNVCRIYILDLHVHRYFSPKTKNHSSGSKFIWTLMLVNQAQSNAWKWQVHVFGQLAPSITCAFSQSETSRWNNFEINLIKNIYYSNYTKISDCSVEFQNAKDLWVSKIHQINLMIEIILTKN